MALKLYERYPQLWESPSNDYPQGAFKNLSAQGETDGSYLEKDWLNDYSGFFGALLRNAEMTPDGTVDTAQRSQFYDALIKVARESVSEEGYRKLDDNIFNGYLQVRSEQGTGVSLQDTGGTVRGQVVATDQGLQLTQYPQDGTSQTFTFPSESGEFALTSYVDAQIEAIPEVDTSNLVTKDDITNELGDSTELVASQALVSSHGLGYGQSWVDVTSQRTAATTYTNNTGKPIAVAASFTGGNKNATQRIYVDNVVASQAYRENGNDFPLFAIVPSSSVYRIEGPGSLRCSELR